MKPPQHDRPAHRRWRLTWWLMLCTVSVGLASTRTAQSHRAVSSGWTHPKRAIWRVDLTIRIQGPLKFHPADYRVPTAFYDAEAGAHLEGWRVPEVTEPTPHDPVLAFVHHTSPLTPTRTLRVAWWTQSQAMGLDPTPELLPTKPAFRPPPAHLRARPSLELPAPQQAWLDAHADLSRLARVTDGDVMAMLVQWSLARIPGPQIRSIAQGRFAAGVLRQWRALEVQARTGPASPTLWPGPLPIAEAFAVRVPPHTHHEWPTR